MSEPFTYLGWCRCGHPRITHTYNQTPSPCQVRDERYRFPDSHDWIRRGDCDCPGFRPPTWRQTLRYWWHAYWLGADSIWGWRR